MTVPLDYGTLFGAAKRAVARVIPDDFYVPAIIRGGQAAAELCQLVAQTYDPHNHPADALVDLKADGLRHLWIGGQQVTREGVPFKAASHVRPALLELERAYGKPMFFDGEYVNDDGLDASIADFQRGKGTGVVWLFDAVPLDEWRRDRCAAPLERRRDLLLDRGQTVFCDGLGALAPFRLGVAETYAKARDIWALGGEGLVVKRGGSLYTRSRSDDWQKLKQSFNAICRITDIGLRPDGQAMRHLLVTYKGRTQRIGSGFSAEQRVLFARQAEHLVNNSEAVVTFSGETKNGLMREAAFVRLMVRS